MKAIPTKNRYNCFKYSGQGTFSTGNNDHARLKSLSKTCTHIVNMHVGGRDSKGNDTVLGKRSLR